MRCAQILGPVASLSGLPRSEPLVVSIPHHLGKEEALRRLKNGLAEVGTSFGHLFSVKEQIWTGDHLRFQVSALGQSASGSIDVADDHVRLEVLLPWFLAKLVGTIQPLIRKEGTLLLEKK
jgi:Putative polyhydroxyalkanoic acid system protein (PHA_gran_rgn)